MAQLHRYLVRFKNYVSSLEYSVAPVTVRLLAGCVQRNIQFRKYDREYDGFAYILCTRYV